MMLFDTLSEKLGRKPTTAEMRAEIERLSQKNPRWQIAHYCEIADAQRYNGPAEPPPYAAQTITNQHGKKVLRLRFESFDDLEKFFVEELIGSSMMAGSSSKVIGTTLLIWDKD